MPQAAGRLGSRRRRRTPAGDAVEASCPPLIQALSSRGRRRTDDMARTVATVAPGSLERLIEEAVARKSSKAFREILAPYEKPSNRRSLVQLAVTVALYGLAWVALLRSVEVGYWLTVTVALPAGGLFVRLINIMHDCSHGSYFTSRRACGAVGRAVAVLVLTPYDHYKRVHARHHAHAGNLDKRVGGDIPTYTVAEYRNATWRRRLAYRLIRNPFALLGLLVPLQFLAMNRIPGRIPRSWKRERRSVWWTNSVLAAALTGVWLTFGIERLGQVAVAQCLVAWFGGVLGGWINHAQHQFEDVYWRRSRDWNFFEAGLQGSSWLALPKPLQWLTLNIGLHHVHHLNVHIPNYRLQRCHDENPQLHSAHRITLRGGLKAMRLALWDEQRSRLVSFAEYRRSVRAMPHGPSPRSVGARN